MSQRESESSYFEVNPPQPPRPRVRHKIEIISPGSADEPFWSPAPIPGTPRVTPWAGGKPIVFDRPPAVSAPPPSDFHQPSSPSDYRRPSSPTDYRRPSSILAYSDNEVVQSEAAPDPANKRPSVTSQDSESLRAESPGAITLESRPWKRLPTPWFRKGKSERMRRMSSSSSVSSAAASLRSPKEAEIDDLGSPKSESSEATSYFTLMSPPPELKVPDKRTLPRAQKGPIDGLQTSKPPRQRGRLFPFRRSKSPSSAPSPHPIGPSTPLAEASSLSPGQRKKAPGKIDITKPSPLSFPASEAQRVATPLGIPRLYFQDATPTTPAPKLEYVGMTTTGRGDGKEAWFKVKLADDDKAIAEEWGIPEHLPSSPLCPRNPKHPSGGTGFCPYHPFRPEDTPTRFPWDLNGNNNHDSH